MFPVHIYSIDAGEFRWRGVFGDLAGASVDLDQFVGLLCACPDLSNGVSLYMSKVGLGGEYFVVGPLAGGRIQFYVCF